MFWLGLSTLVLGCRIQASTSTGPSKPNGPGPDASAADQTGQPPPSIDPKGRSNTLMPDIDFGLRDSDYWKDPTRTMWDVVEKLWKLKRDVVALGAPQFVSLGRRRTLPVFVMRAGPYAELFKYHFIEHAMIAVVDLERNQVRLGPVFREDNAEEAEATAPSDEAKIPEGNGSENCVVDLRKDLGVEWRPATLLVTVIARDLVSNRVRIELGESPGVHHDKEVERRIADERKRATPVKVSPAAGKTLPCYAETGGSPKIPEEFGVAITLPQVVAAKPGWTAIMRGAFRLRVREQERVTTPVVEGAGRDEPPTAVVGITLIVMGNDMAEGSMLRLDVPSWDKLDPKDPIATGYFALDLRERHMIGTHPQTRFLYALSNEHLTGPVPTALVVDVDGQRSAHGD
jgi:hypothetical protein